MSTINYALTHLFSQLSRKWIPLPQTEKHYDEFDFYALSRGDWLSYIKEGLNARNRPEWVSAFRKKVVKSMLLPEIADRIHHHFEMLNRLGGKYIPYNSPHFPTMLKHVPDPPAAISALGSLCNMKTPCLAIVGSRKASGFALFESEKLATWIGDQGVTVVSGGALGVDRAAHCGTLNCTQSPSPGIVVLPSGLDRLYPSANKHIFSLLLREKALFISEKLCGHTPYHWDFPTRNRIISGLSVATIIMQADIRSGAMSSAGWALNQGRDVFVLEHPQDDIRAQGSHHLIETGAVGFRSAEDFMINLFPLCLDNLGKISPKSF